MKTALLVVTALAEASTGLALLVAPSAVASLLTGAPLETPTGLLVGRVTGAALVALGLSCWAAASDPGGPGARGLIASMLLYNVAVAALLVYGGFGLGLAGVGCWPAVALHTLLAVWCIACCRNPETVQCPKQ